MTTRSATFPAPETFPARHRCSLRLRQRAVPRSRCPAALLARLPARLPKARRSGSSCLLCSARTTCPLLLPAPPRGARVSSLSARVPVLAAELASSRPPAATAAQSRRPLRCPPPVGLAPRRQPPPPLLALPTLAASRTVLRAALLQVCPMAPRPVQAALDRLPRLSGAATAAACESACSTWIAQSQPAFPLPAGRRPPRRNE